MKLIIKLLRYICFFIGVVFVIPLIVGLFTSIALVFSFLVALFIVVGCSPFILIFLYLLPNVSTHEIRPTYNTIANFIGVVSYALSVIIGFGYGVYYSVLSIKEWYESWF